MPEMILGFNDETHAVSAGPPKKEADENEAMRAIMDYLSSLTEPVEEKAIDEAVDGRKAVLVRALRELVKKGEVVRTGRGRRNDTFHYAKRN